jgi:glycosyltransferase involved in cell wall biosynthesis
MVTELSIVIPALNEADYLPRLLDSIAKQTYQGKLEVIVVDGDSEDNTAGIARSYAGRVPGLQVIAARRDIGRQRNQGAERAQYHYLLFLDADVLLPPHFLEQLAAKTKITKPFVAAAMHTAENVTFFDRIFLAVGYTLCFIAWVSRVPMINGDFIFTTRENHRKIGGFAEGALMGEDADYGLRSIRAGAVYRFYFRPVILGSPRRAREIGRARLMLLWARAFVYVRKHGPIYKDSAFGSVEYPFGQYGRVKKK